MKSEILINWFKSSGLKINPEKTEETRTIELDGREIKTRSSMNILGVIFDCNLNWQKHINTAIIKSRKTLQAIRFLSRFLPFQKLIQVCTSYFYQKLYYGAAVWLTPFLKKTFKHKLLQASASALRICCKDYKKLLSFKNLHIICNRALPDQWSQYATALHLYKIFMNKSPSFIYDKLLNKIVSHDRTDTLYIRPTNTNKIGANCLSNRIMALLKLIKKNEWQLSLDLFKVTMKKRFLNPMYPLGHTNLV